MIKVTEALKGKINENSLTSKRKPNREKQNFDR